MARNFVRSSVQYAVYAGAPVTNWPLTIAVWHKHATTGTTQFVWSLSDFSGSRGIDLMRHSGGTVRAQAYGNGGTTVESGVAPGTAWVHTTFVGTNDTSRALYVNGTKVSDSTSVDLDSGGTLAEQFWLGDAYWGTTHNMDGDEAEVAIWSAALTDDEVNALQKGFSPLLIRPQSLVAYWPLSGNDSPERDRGKNGYNLTLTNGPTKADHPRIYYPSHGKTSFYFSTAASFAADLAAAAVLVASLSVGAGFSAAATGAATTSAALTTGESLRADVTGSAATVATLGTGSRLQADATGSATTTGTFALLVPVGQVSAELAGTEWRTRVGSVGVRDLLNDAPNTCSFTVEGAAPTVGQEVRILLGVGTVYRDRLFAGTVQSVEHIYEGRTANLAWRVTCTDYTALLNHRRPFGDFVNVSATTIAQGLVTTFAPPDFTSTDVEAGLPEVSVTFDGSEDFMKCVAQLATLIGGYARPTYDKGLALFLEDTSDPPDPIDAAHPPLDDPPIAMTVDDSQLRNRVYVTAHGEATPEAVPAGETVIPIADTVMFNPLGGKAITGGQRLDYTGVQAGGGEAVIGTSVTPTNAPTVAPRSGTGMASGDYRYAVAFLDAAGKTLPSPLSALLTLGGVVTAPASAPTVARGASGGSLGAGAYQWKVTFVDAAGGETTPSGASSALTIIAAPSAPATIGVATYELIESDLDGTANYGYKYTFYQASTGTESAPSAASTFSTYDAPYNGGKLARSGVASPPAGFNRRFYRTEGGGSTYLLMRNGPSEGFAYDDINYYYDDDSDGSLGAAAPTAAVEFKRANLTIPISPDANVVSRKIYRTVAGGSTFKLVTTIANNTATTHTDSAADGSLGADAPSTSTALLNQAALTGITIGPSGTTGRELFRTAVNGSQLKSLATISNNTATTYTDAAADGTLGANVHTVNTSALVAAVAEVPAGATILPVTATGPFAAGGGWATVGQMLVRYGAISASTLTGIPASGIGSILTTIKSGEHVVAAPALTGVTGLTSALLYGAMVSIFVQRDDLAAQAEQALRTDPTGTLGHDGVVEYHIRDGRIREDTAVQWADADLARFSRPIVTVPYATRDPKTASGKTVHIDLAGILGDFVIQSVTIDQIDVAPGLYPRYTVEASSVRFSLEDVLRRLQL
jgi:hypothetical protein